MTREEFYNLTDILNSEVLGNFMHGGEADELLAMFEEAVDHSNILEQEEPVSEDLLKASMEFAKGFGEWHYAIPCFQAGVEWQKKHLWKDAQGDDLPEIDREVIVLTQKYPLEGSEYAVSFAHRPYKGKYIGKSLTTGNIETFENETYGKGGWSIPDVKWWLDCGWPNKEGQ